VIAKAKSAMLAEQTVRYAVTVSDSASKQSYSVIANLGEKVGTEDFASGTASAHVPHHEIRRYFLGQLGRARGVFRHACERMPPR